MSAIETLDNDAFDAAVLAAIKAGNTDFTRISVALGLPPMRAIDRALQRLRRAGHITYDRKARKWSLVNVAAEPVK